MVTERIILPSNPKRYGLAPMFELLERGATYEQLLQFWEQHLGGIVSRPLGDFLNEARDTGAIERWQDGKYYLMHLGHRTNRHREQLTVVGLLPEYSFHTRRTLDGIGIDTTYPLDPNSLASVISDLQHDPLLQVVLRSTGIEVLCETLDLEKKIGCLSAGMLVSGMHIPQKEPEDLFAVTFKYDPNQFKGWGTEEASTRFKKHILPYGLFSPSLSPTT